MNISKKRKLYEKHYERLLDEKKSVSIVVVASNGIFIRNCGKEVEYKEVDILRRVGSSIEVWHWGTQDKEKQKLPSETSFYYMLADGRLLAADGLEDASNPKRVFVCGCKEENDDISFLMLITFSGGYVFKYWDGGTRTSCIALIGKSYDETLPNLYRNIRNLEQKLAQAQMRRTEITDNPESDVWQDEVTPADMGEEDMGEEDMDCEDFAWNR